MRTKSNATQNRTTGISRAAWRVISVESLPEFCLLVQFMDGTCGKIDMAEFIKSTDAGVFAILKDESIFRQVHVEFGVVTWPNEIDLAPDTMHQEIKKNGYWKIKSKG